MIDLLYVYITSLGKDSKAWKMGAAWINRSADGTTPKHMWNPASTSPKEIIFASNCDWRWKMDLFKKSQTQKSMGWPRPDQPSTSSARPDRFGQKIMLCVWWDQKGVVYIEIGTKLLASAELGNVAPPAIFTRPCSFRLSLVLIDGPRTCWTRRCAELAWWLVCLKRGRVILATNPQIAREMGKMCS